MITEMVRIVTYEEKHREAFRELNESWIERFFEIEEMDKKILSDPESSIIAQGGMILMAELEGVAVGTCALLKKDEVTYELAKMAVSPNAQGQGIGFILGNSIIDLAKEKGAKTLYLETNSVLKPAIQLYKKLGFTQVNGYCTPYDRCDLHMEMKF